MDVKEYEVSVYLDESMKGFLDDLAGIRGCSYRIGTTQKIKGVDLTLVTVRIDQTLKRNPNRAGRKKGTMRKVEGSPTVRDVYEMLHETGMTQAEVAKQLDISVRTLQRRIERARKDTAADSYDTGVDKDGKDVGGWNADNQDLF